MSGDEGGEAKAIGLTPQFMTKTDPVQLFSSWMADAESSEPSDANAMTVATIGKDGIPNARILLLKGHDAEGFVFYTNSESAKGEELALSPSAALCFYWKSLGRQVRIRGAIAPVSAEEADAYFRTRPERSRIGAWASNQSRPLESRAVLEQAVSDYEKKYENAEIPRPPHWSGYKLTPVEIEFWENGPFRLHNRVRFYKDSINDNWQKTLLYP